jgi:uncharacterized protein (TIGR03437 family)
MRLFFAYLALAVAAQAATINTTLTITNAALTIGASSTLAGPCTLSGIGNCSFTATVSAGATGNFTGPFTITVTSSGDTITGTFNVPESILGGSGSGSASVSGGTGAYVNASGSFPNLSGSGNAAGASITISLSGAGTIVTGGPPAPSVTAVLDAASYTPTVAQGSIFVVKGSNMSAGGFTETSFPLPTTFGGVTITFTPASGSGAATKAYIIYLYNQGGVNQLAAVAPSSLTPGSYNLTVTNNNGVTSGSFGVTIVARKADLVTQDSTGNGLAVIQNYISASQLDVNRFTTQTVAGFTISPAKPGQTEILYVVGMGAVPGGSDNTASPGYDFTQHGVTVQVNVGGMNLTPSYAGRAPGLTGVDQVNFTLPANVSTGCEIQVQLIVNGTASLSTTFMAIAADANSTSCIQSGFTTSQLSNFDQGAVVTQGSFLIDQFGENQPGVGNIKVDTSTGAFTLFTGFELPSIPVGAAAAINISSLIGTCQVTQINPVPTGTIGLVPAGGINLDAGKTTLTGPSGSNLTNTPYIESSAYGYTLSIGYEGAPVPPGSGYGNGIIVGGNYTIAAAGGNDVNAFNVTLAFSPLTITGGLPTTVTRGSGLTLNWTGGNPTDLVEISGESVTISASGETGASFVCFTTAGQQTFTVPASILSQLQAVSAAAESSGSASGSLGVISTTSTTFTATRVADGSAIPSTFSGLAGSEGSSVVYQ